MLDVSVLYGLFSVSDVVHSFIYLLRVHLLSCKGLFAVLSFVHFVVLLLTFVLFLSLYFFF